MTDSNSGRSDSSDPYGPGSSGSGDSPWSSNWSSSSSGQDPQPAPGSASSSGSASDWPGYSPGSGQPPTSQPSASDPQTYGGGYQQPYPQTPQYGQQQYGGDQSAYGSNPYETTPYQGGGSYPYGYAAPLPNHPQAVTAMVLGIVSIAASCLVLGIPAWLLGAKARREIDASPGTYAGRGMATAGWVLGIVATAILGIAVVAILFAAIGGALSQ